MKMTTAYGTTKIVDTTFVTDHVAKLTGLTGQRTYYYKITSQNTDGSQTTTGTGTFVTK